ncbi:MAG: sigma-70 family RNA polymerase sigma factor [Planctomycetota bacterium]
MQENERSDEELVQLTLAGDRSAFQVLVERHQHRIFRLARHYLRSNAEVEDMVQDTFLKAFSKLDTFQSNSSFFTWVYRIAKNTILDNLKRKGRSPVRAMEDPEDSLGRVAEGRSGRVPMPDARMMKSEITRVTRSVLETLPDIFREVLVLRELEGQSYQEIAETLEISIGTVESRIFRARAKFKDKLMQMHPEIVEGM